MYRLGLLVGLILMSAFCCVWQTFQVVQIGRSITKYKACLKDIMFRERSLQLQVSSLSSLDRIEGISKNQLGLTGNSKLKEVVVNSVEPLPQLSDKVVLRENIPTLGQFLSSFVGVAQARTVHDE